MTTTRSTVEGVRFSVADQRPGHGASRLQPIINLFETDKAERLGFDLGISRSIVRTHGGRLWSEANPERGAMFHFVIPNIGESA